GSRRDGGRHLAAGPRLLPPPQDDPRPGRPHGRPRARPTRHRPRARNRMDGHGAGGRGLALLLNLALAAVTDPSRDPGRAPFSAHLRRLADPIWRAQLAHPFVRGIGNGSLDPQRFHHWVRQDYRFLVEYCRLFGLAAARAPDLDTLVRFADLLQATA